MFERTLGLSDNPFDPRVSGARKNLAGEALRIDRDPNMAPLFSWNLAGLGGKKTEIDHFLFEPGQQTSVEREGIIVLRGGRGTGKTSLAGYVRDLVLKRPRTNGNWKDSEYSFPASESDRADGGFFTKLSVVREEVAKKLGPNPINFFLFLDDVPRGGLGAIVDLFADNKNHFQIYVVTTTDPDIKQKDLDWASATRINIIETSNLKAGDLTTYIGDRVRLYRKPTRDEFEKISPIFPWQANVTERMFTSMAPDQPFRMLNRTLSKQCEAHHYSLEKDQNFDIAAVPEAKLRDYLIP